MTTLFDLRSWYIRAGFPHAAQHAGTIAAENGHDLGEVFRAIRYAERIMPSYPVKLRPKRTDGSLIQTRFPQDVGRVKNVEPDEPRHTAVSRSGEGRGQRGADHRATDRAVDSGKRDGSGAHGPDASGNREQQVTPVERVEGPRSGYSTHRRLGAERTGEA